MQKLFFTLLVFLSIRVSAQIEFTNSILAEPSQNLLFIGIDNPIIVSGKGWNATTMDLRTNHPFGVSKVEEDKFIVRVSAISDSFPIIITSGDKVILTKYYRVRTIEQMAVRIGEIDKDGSFTNKEIIANPVITFGIKHLNSKNLNFYGYSKTNKLVSYIVKITNEKVELLHESTNTVAHFSDEQLAIIKSLKPGARVELRKCIAPGTSSDFELRGLKLTIK